MSDLKDIGRFLFKVVESFGVQQELKNETGPKNGRCVRTLKRIGSLGIFSDIAISSFQVGQNILNLERSWEHENGL